MAIERKIGIHLSISGGIYTALERANNLGVTAVQFFLKNSNQWKGKDYSDDDIKSFKTLSERFGADSLFAHSGYLINIAGDGENLEKSIISLRDEIQRADSLGVKYIVLHPGSHKGHGIESGINRVCDSLEDVFTGINSSVTILLETTAGQGNSIGSRFEHLSEIITRSSLKDHLGVCLDTCHVFAAGYDISKTTGLDKTLEEFQRLIGLENLKLIHLNDSKRESGSGIDRHEHIGEGEIGKGGFKIILNHDKLKSIPVILETPKFNDDEADIINLKKVYSICGIKTKNKILTK